MARLGLLIWRGCVKETFENATIAVDCVSFPRARTSMWELNAFVCPLVPCVVPSCVLGVGVLWIHYLLPRAAGKLVFHSHSCENCFWYLCTSVGLWGSQECSLNSCAWNDVAVLVGSPPLSLSNPCCSSLFPTHAQSTCFMFSLLHSWILPPVLNQFNLLSQLVAEMTIFKGKILSTWRALNNIFKICHLKTRFLWLHQLSVLLVISIRFWNTRWELHSDTHEDNSSYNMGGGDGRKVKPYWYAVSLPCTQLVFSLHRLSHKVYENILPFINLYFWKIFFIISYKISSVHLHACNVEKTKVPSQGYTVEILI